MGLLLVGIGIGLLVSGAVALVRAIAGSGSNGGHVHDPLHVEVARSDREPWAVAFRDDAPELALAGLEHLSHVESYRALRDHGGVDFHETELRLRLSTHHADAVVVREISVSVVRRDPPFTGRLVGVGSSPAGESTPFVYDLDADDPGEKAGAFLAANTITVRRDATADVSIVGMTTSAYCQWRIHIDAGTGDEFHRMIVDDDGLPFETTGCDRDAFANGIELLD
jgi:hypothetical protein